MMSYENVIKRIIAIGEEIDPLLTDLSKETRKKIKVLQYERKILSEVCDGE